MLPSTRPRVLCVDDDEDSRVMLVTLLGLASIEAKAAETANQALSLMQLEHFDLYMLDAWLPEIGGFELCRRMRAFDPCTPIVFFSGAACADDKKKGLCAGADAYVFKPDIYELVERIKKLTSYVTEPPVVQEMRPLAERPAVFEQAIPLPQQLEVRQPGLVTPPYGV